MAKYPDILQRFEASGMSRKEFAHQEGMAPSTLSYHLNKGRKNKSTLFSEVQVLDDNKHDHQIRIITRSGTEIYIPL